MAYTRVNATWADNTGQQVNAAFLNGVESALVSLFGVAPLTNGAMVWDGTQFRADAKLAAANITAGAITNTEINAAAAIAKTKLAALAIAQSDMAAGNKITTGTWTAGPPGSPTTGDIWIATAVDANGTAWMFQYDNAQATYKWVFIGGPPATHEISTQEAIITLGAVYADLTTAGPRVTGMRAGEYWASVYANAVQQNSADNMYLGIAYAASGGTTVVQTIVGRSAVAGDVIVMAGAITATPTAGQEIRIRYAGNLASEAWKQRALSVVPRRVI